MKRRMSRNALIGFPGNASLGSNWTSSTSNNNLNNMENWIVTSSSREPQYFHAPPSYANQKSPFIQFIASFFPPSKNKFCLACFSICRTKHLEQITNIDIKSACSISSFKANLKTPLFSAHWSRDRAPQIRLRRFGMCALYKWLLSLALSFDFCEIVGIRIRRNPITEPPNAGSCFGLVGSQVTPVLENCRNPLVSLHANKNNFTTIWD